MDLRLLEVHQQAVPALGVDAARPARHHAEHARRGGGQQVLIGVEGAGHQLEEVVARGGLPDALEVHQHAVHGDDADGRDALTHAEHVLPGLGHRRAVVPHERQVEVRHRRPVRVDVQPNVADLADAPPVAHAHHRARLGAAAGPAPAPDKPQPAHCSPGRLRISCAVGWKDISEARDRAVRRARVQNLNVQGVVRASLSIRF